MTKKEITPRESKRNLTLSTLEKKLMQDTLGSNLIQSDPFKYGQVGKESSQNHLQGEEFQKEGQKEYQKKVAEYDSMGIFGEPNYPNSSEISYSILKGLDQVMESAYLEDLYEGVKKVAPELELELPEELGKYTSQDVIKSIHEKGAISEKGLDASKLNNEEKVVMNIYNMLKETYRNSVALNMINSNYISETNAQLKQIIENYNKSKEKIK